MKPSSGDNNKKVSSVQTSQMLNSDKRVPELEKDVQSLPSSSSSHTAKSIFSPANSDDDQMPPLGREFTLNLENDAKNLALPMAYSVTDASLSDNNSHDPLFEVSFKSVDSRDPKQWPLWYRCFMVASAASGAVSLVIQCTGYTRSVPGMLKEFKLENKSNATYGITTFLFGIASGSLLLAPLSEIYGRRPVYIVSMFLYCVMLLPCALAKSLPYVIGGRFFSAFFGSVMVSNPPGTIFDIFSEKYRPLALSIWSLAPLIGPAIGPLIGGFVAEKIGWRGNTWLVLILAGISLLFLASMRESYMPVLLQKEVERLRKETGDSRYWCRFEKEKSVIAKLKTNLSRPFILAFTEPILWFWNLYVAFIYGTLYLCFIAYPLIFGEIRGWSEGITGLAFLGLGVGTILSIMSEPLLRRLVNMHKKDPKTGKIPLESSVSVICIAAVLCPLGQLWFSWTAVPATIHWIWPILAGIPFGASICIVIVYGSNYLGNTYGIYAASALAGNVVARNSIGGVIPLLGASLYSKVGPRWGGTILGLILAAMTPIPFIFYKWGPKIRARSPLIRQIQADIELREKMDEAAAARQNTREKDTRDVEEGV